MDDVEPPVNTGPLFVPSSVVLSSSRHIQGKSEFLVTGFREMTVQSGIVSRFGKLGKNPRGISGIGTSEYKTSKYALYVDVCGSCGPLALCCLYFEGGFSIHCHSADEEGVPALPGPLMARGQNNRRPAR